MADNNLIKYTLLVFYGNNKEEYYVYGTKYFISEMIYFYDNNNLVAIFPKERTIISKIEKADCLPGTK